MVWSDHDHDAVLKALAVVCEVTGTELSDAAKRFMLQELQTHPALDVAQALRVCSRSCKGRLSLAEVIRQLEYVDRKALSDARASRQCFETTLRGLALVERIPWEGSKEGQEKIRKQLEEKGYRLGERPKEAKALPAHWTETERD